MLSVICYSTRTTSVTLHYTTLHYTTLHYTVSILRVVCPAMSTLPQVVGEFDFVSAYNVSGVLTTVYTPVGKAEQVTRERIGRPVTNIWSGSLSLERPRNCTPATLSSQHKR